MKEKNTFWGITTFFNPAGYKNKYENYKKFRESSKKQGLNLLAVELVFGNEPFVLKKGDAEKLIQIRGGRENIMWQKEALLNIAFENLPKECDKFAWLDCDIIFENNNWVKETSRLLNDYYIVQPFSKCIRLKKCQSIKEVKRTESIIKNEEAHGLVYNICEFNSWVGYPGFAWASRKDVFKDLGFYDRAIIGSGDVVLVRSFFGSDLICMDSFLKETSIEDSRDYAKKVFSRVKGRVGYLSGTLFHLWHGNNKDRNYSFRHIVLRNNSFSPKTDVRKNSQGILEWDTKNEKLKNAVRGYFQSRCEEKVNFGRRLIYGLRNVYTWQVFWILLNEKKHFFLGRVGMAIKRISPRAHKNLVKIKPRWMSF